MLVVATVPELVLKKLEPIGLLATGIRSLWRYVTEGLSGR